MDYLLVLPLFLIVAYYIGAPVLLYVSLKISVHPTLQPAALSALPPELIHYFIENSQRLQAEGFQSLREYTLDGEEGDSKTTLATLAHAETGDRAVITALLLRFEEDWRPLMQYVEITARFEDGSRLVSTNRREPDWFPARGAKRVFRFAPAQDCRELYRLHRRAAALHAPESPPVSIPPEADSAVLLLQEFREDCESQRRAKTLFFDAARGVYRPTLRGAFRLTWRLLFPFRAALLLQDRARASALKTKWMLYSGEDKGHG